MSVHAVLLEAGSGPTWYHRSTRGESVIHRKFVNGVMEVVNFETVDDEIEEATKPERLLELPLEQVKTLCKEEFDTDPESWTYEDKELWSRVLHQLSERTQELLARSVGQPLSSDEQGRPEFRAVPTTTLRRYYQGLRGYETGFHAALAEGLASRVKLIAAAWRRSCKQLEGCSGPPSWKGASRKSLPCPITLSDSETGLQIASWIESQGGMAAPSGEFWTFVDRELCPLGTSGGIDVLLVREDDGNAVPVVGEIKGRNDTTVFLALMQSLAYAVELSQPKVLGSLQPILESSDAAAGVAFEDSPVDIAILSAGREDQTVDATSQLIEKLNRLDRVKMPGLGTIHLLHADGDRWVAKAGEDGVDR